MKYRVYHVGLIVLLLCLAAVGVQAQMPDFVLRAAQAINARYGQKIDVNNVYWDYRAYSVPGYDPADYCPNLEAGRPPFAATTKNFMVVMFTIIRDGLRTTEEWHYLVYDDFTYLGPCLIPAPPTPVPTLGPTPIPPTPSNCGGLAPRLAIGQQGRVTPGDPNNVRENHAVSTRLLGEIPAGGVFTVLDGPRCTGDGTWWRVDYNGLQGWTLEGNAGVYFVEPASFPTPTVQASATVATATPAPTFTPTRVLPTVVPTQIVCLPAIPPRLRIGETARVTAGGIPNNMRELSGRSSKLIGEIPPLGMFTVLEGPVCTGDGAWWRVNYNGLIGWTLEGMEAEYWVEPMLPNLQPMTVENAIQLRPLPNWSSTSNGAGFVPNLVSNDGLVSVKNGATVHNWSPQDIFAPAATLNWTLQQGIIDPALVLTNGQWNVYGMVVPIAPDAVISDTKTSMDGRWVIFSQGSVLSTINRTPDVADADRVKALPDAHGEAIMAMEFSANSSTLVTISAHKIYAWDTATWQPRLIYEISSSDPITAWTEELVFAISPTGQHVFVAPGQMSMGLVIATQGNMEARRGSVVATRVQSAAFVRDEWVAVGGTDDDGNSVLIALDVVSLQTGTLITESPVDDVQEGTNEFTSIVVNSNGTLMATYNASTGIRVWGVWEE